MEHELKVSVKGEQCRSETQTHNIIPVSGPRNTAYPDIAEMNVFAVYGGPKAKS